AARPCHREAGGRRHHGGTRRRPAGQAFMNEGERSTGEAPPFRRPIPLLGALILVLRVRFISSGDPLQYRGRSRSQRALALASPRYLAASCLSRPPSSVGIRVLTPRRLQRAE